MDNQNIFQSLKIHLIENPFAWLYLFFYAILLLVCTNIFATIIEFILDRKIKLSDQSVILVTGGLNGIGELLCYEFAEKHKCKIVIFDILQQKANIVIDKIKLKGGKGYFYYCDLNDKEQIDASFKNFIEQFKVIDILVNNAGIFPGKTFQDTSMDLMRKTINVNFLSPIQLTKLTLPYMLIAGRGQISFTCSVMGLVYGQKSTHYSSSKAALQLLVETLNIEYQMYMKPIGFTLICPWAINTGLLDCVNMEDIYKYAPPLDQKYVAKQMYKSIIYKKNLVYLSPIFKYITILTRILPVNLLDKVALLFDI